MAPVRRLLPPLGGLDLSPILVFVIINVLEILLRGGTGRRASAWRGVGLLMAETGPFWRWQGEVLSLRCQVQPRASADRIIGEHGGRLRIRISAVPSEGAANERLCRFLASEFGVAPGAVEIGTGHGSRFNTALVRAPARIPPDLGHRAGPRLNRKAHSCKIARPTTDPGPWNREQRPAVSAS